MSHRDEIEASAEELLLVDLLYGELDEEQASSARDAVAADTELSAQVEAYRGLRELFRELPAEEPPAAVSAQLLHAAAIRAPAVAPDPEAAGAGIGGFFKRLFQPLLLHPAVAAATTFVLVVGVAGTLYLVGGVGVSQRHATTAPAPEAASRLEAVPATPRAEPSLEPSRGARSSQSTADNWRGEASADQEVNGFGAAGTARQRATIAKPSHNAPVTKSGDTERNKDLDLGEGRFEVDLAKKPAPPPAGGETADQGAATGAGHRVEGSSEQVISVETPPPPLKQLDDTRDRSGAGDQVEEKTLSEEDEASPTDAPVQNKGKAESPPRPVERLHTQARRAARDGECRAVLELAKKVRGLDAGYYAKVFLVDPQLAACLHPPASKKR